MALATQPDVEASLGRPLSAEEAARVVGLLEEASDLVIGYLHPCPIPDPTPAAIKRVAATMVATSIRRPALQPEGATTLGAGPYNVGISEAASSAAPYLTAALKARLAPFRCGNGMVSMPLVSERYP